MIMQRLSLLARGTRYRWRNAELLVRFIPAGAGNTVAIRNQYRPAPVYPRWRGEHRVLFAPAVVDFGLSPLARGTHNLDKINQYKSRFIPAGAGNTLNVYHCL